MQRRSRSPIRSTPVDLDGWYGPVIRRFGAIGARECAELGAIREGDCPAEHDYARRTLMTLGLAVRRASFRAQPRPSLPPVAQRRPSPLPRRFLLALGQAARRPDLPGGALADPLMWFEAAVAIDRRAPSDPATPVGEPVTPVGDPEDVVDLITDEEDEDVLRCNVCGEFSAICFAARRHCAARESHRCAIIAREFSSRTVVEFSSRTSPISASPVARRAAPSPAAAGEWGPPAPPPPMSPPRSRDERWSASGGTSGRPAWSPWPVAPSMACARRHTRGSW